VSETDIVLELSASLIVVEPPSAFLGFDPPADWLKGGIPSD